MPSRRSRKHGRKTKFVTKRGLPFQLMKFAESKFHDKTATNFLLLSPADYINNVFVATDISRGTGSTSRVGNIVQVSGYYMRMTYESVQQVQAEYMRLIIYTPKQDMLSSELPANDMVSAVDPRRFIIWHDKTVLCANAPGGSKGVMVIKKRFKPYLKLEWDSSNELDVTKGQLLVLALGRTNEAVRINFDFRLHYRDV